MHCPNIKHNLSWSVGGTVNPCNNLINFPNSKNVDEMYNLTEYRELITNDRSSYCQRCWDKESLGIVSKRQSDIKLHEVYSKIDDGYLKIDAAIGMVCNAACRTCGPSSSSLWQQYEQNYTTIKSETPNQDLWSTINKNLNRVLQLDFGGGEPWLNQVDEQILAFEQLIEQGLARRVKLRYNTNGSLYPRRLLETFSHFRSVEITLSLDGLDKQFEYIRYPLKWETVVSNVQELQQLSSKFSNIKLTVNYTVSVLSFLYANKFLHWANSNNLPNVNWNIVTIPEIYNIKHLPLSAKQQITTDCMFYDLVAKDPDPTWATKFFAETKRLDHNRNQSFSDTFPELQAIL